MYATILRFELIKRALAKAPLIANLRRKHPGFLFLIIPMIWASVKRLFRMCLPLRKVEQTLHHDEGSFGRQLKDTLGPSPQIGDCFPLVKRGGYSEIRSEIILDLTAEVRWRR